MNLRKKTIKGVLWNAFEMFGGKIIQIVITVILARMLTPEDFGVIGLLVIFTELSKVILDSGFSQALIRKQDSDQTDFTSVFYFNIFIGIVVYSGLYLLAPLISDFYNYPELTNISRVVFLTIFINSFGIVQNAKIIKEVNFKILANRTIIANLLAGILAVYLAYNGFGVWALVIQMVLASFLRVIFLWVFAKWVPSLSFSFKPIRILFAFSGNLLLSGMFDVIASNIQTLLIGKFYTKADLGFYTQGKQLSVIPSQTLTTVVRNVTYPTLSVLQNKDEQLKQAYRKVIRIAFFIVFPLMLGLVVVADKLIPLVLGDAWKPAVKYFMLLCITGAIFPLYSINQNIFLIKGNSKLYLMVSIALRIITFISIAITIWYSVLVLVIGQVIATIVNTLIIMYYSGREIGYGLKEQFGDISSTMFISSVLSFIIYYIGIEIVIINSFWTIFAQFIIGLILFLFMSFILNLKVLKDLKDIFLSLKNRDK
ncbi:lipopolysaccharide biosynthesis protein [Algoriphagus antarcticus]|jgi:O-antigen/teichoic acid export membrane protein|uniref:O-antigen/teichoic acid export membrane protein n=1 Tax=Algoriphagus antarcticus TaxID=238540 RepID=A0A3E0D7E2_9BACT|nr:lipopolysaccharide biosynthesis protein [Algoriphagus antarcticus]REG77488.1 O-antigen/teichoic acid export membrane protein [Algoriphagus antarcticus]